MGVVQLGKRLAVASPDPGAQICRHVLYLSGPDRGFR
jgi:hypothetical protein